MTVMWSQLIAFNSFWHLYVRKVKATRVRQVCLVTNLLSAAKFETHLRPFGAIECQWSRRLKIASFVLTSSLVIRRWSRLDCDRKCEAGILRNPEGQTDQIWIILDMHEWRTCHRLLSPSVSDASVHKIAILWLRRHVPYHCIEIFWIAKICVSLQGAAFERASHV